MVIHWGVSFTEAFLFSNAAFCSTQTCLLQKTTSPHLLSSMGFFYPPLHDMWTRAWGMWWLAYGHGKYGCICLVPLVCGYKPMFLLLQPDSQSTEDKRSPWCSAGFGLSLILFLLGSPRSAPAKLPWELAGKLPAVKTARSDFKKASPLPQLAVSPCYFEATAIIMNKKRR